jgi:hypothetical protein
MPMFGRNRRSPADPRSLSATVEEQDECWHVTWLGERNELPDLEAASLTEATDLAAKMAQALDTARGRPSGAVLSFAIYPRGAGNNALVYDVSGGPGQFKARDTQDSGQQVHAANLEELVAAARHQAWTDYAMLCWVRPLEELPTEQLEQ